MHERPVDVMATFILVLYRNLFYKKAPVIWSIEQKVKIPSLRKGN